MGSGLESSLPQWITDYAHDQYGIDINQDLGAGKEIPEKVEVEWPVTEFPSWWQTYWQHCVVIAVGIMFVAILVFAGIYLGST